MVPELLAFVSWQGYFAKSIFQVTCILHDFMVSNLSDLLVYRWRDASHAYNKSVFARIRKRHQNFHINLKHKVMWEEECQGPDQEIAKTSLKAACSWITYDRNSIEFQFWAKSSLENISLPLIHQISVKWIVQFWRNRETWNSQRYGSHFFQNKASKLGTIFWDTRYIQRLRKRLTVLFGAIFSLRNKAKFSKSWRKKSCLRMVSVGIPSLVDLIRTIKGIGWFGILYRISQLYMGNVINSKY